MARLDDAAKAAWQASPESRHGPWESLSEAEKFGWRKIARAVLDSWFDNGLPPSAVFSHVRPLRADALDDNPEDLGKNTVTP